MLRRSTLIWRGWQQEKQILLEVTLSLLTRTCLTVTSELAVVAPIASSLLQVREK